MEISKLRQKNPNNPIAAASSNLFVGEISFVETSNFYLNVSA